MRVAFSLRLGVMLTMIVLASARSHTALSAQVAAERPLTGAPTFCQEVLILHHSHLDVGFTHPQSMCWELQQDFFDEALDLLDRTEGWPDESRPRWTAEVTAPVVRWLATADSRRLERFRHHLRSGRLAISGFEYNTTPLCTAEGLARQLAAVRVLRERFGARICSANQQDVTGIPWTAVDLLLDSDIPLLIMAINLHLSGTPLPRPAVYRWRGPSGRELLVMNGEHYSMFDQWTEPASRDLNHMQQGLNRYLTHLQGLHYPYDFVYLSATCAPLQYDNSPPNHDLPELVRQWNAEKRQPRLRFVTPAELLERIRRIPRESLPVVTGDWTDYWNFGCGSSAVETRLTRRMTADAALCDLLEAMAPAGRRTAAALDRLWDDIHLYNEHTWGAHNSLSHDDPFAVTQWHLKAAPVYDGAPLGQYLVRRGLQALAGNPHASWKSAGILVVNPSGLPQDYYVSATVPRGERKWLEAHVVSVPREPTPRPVSRLHGPVRLEPFSWRVLPWSQLTPAPPSNEVKAGSDFIETSHYRLTFEPATGKVTRLLDKQQSRELIARDASWGFFQLVHERPTSNERRAFHVRSVEGERYGRTGWKPDWAATRTSYNAPVRCAVEKHDRAATLVVRGQAEGVSQLEQRITLHADSPLIDLYARFLKQDVRTPEALYFAFPLALAADWRAHFDTAGIPTELDAEQLRGSCRDWVTVDTFVSVHRPDGGVTLYCPDAPLVQVGGFHFAQKQEAIRRTPNPSLLAWPLNNYWETNFRAAQPGWVELRYAFRSHGPFDPVRARREGQREFNPPVTHPVWDDATPRQGRFIEVTGAGGVVVEYCKRAQDGDGMIVRLVNLADKSATSEVRLPGRTIVEAWQCGLLEDNRAALPLDSRAAACPLTPRQLSTIRLKARTRSDEAK
jgi:hypothetical protein